MIRPYLPAPRATVRAVPRTGRPPAALSAARLSAAAAIVRDEPTISGAELARRLGVAPTRGARLLAEIRASVPDVEAPPPIGSGRTVYLRAATLAALAAATGRPVGDDVDAQIGEVLARVKATPEAALDHLDPARSGEE